MNGPSSPGALVVGVYLAFILLALYAAWHLAAAVRERRGGREVTARVLHLAGVGILLYTMGIEMWREQVPPPSRSPTHYLGYVAAGLLLLGNVVHGMKPRSPG